MTGLREIATFYDPEEAHVAAGFMNANGFHVSLADNEMLMQSPTHRVALGGFRLMAPAHEALEARDLLREVRKTPNKASAPCPNCNENDFRRVKSLWFPAIFLLLMGAVVPFATNSSYLKCRKCKTRVTKNFAASMEAP